MLKSLFFKHRVTSDELLPPPPPFPSLELEEETAKPGKERIRASKESFDDLFEDEALETKHKAGKSGKKSSKLKKEKRSAKDVLKNLGIESIKPEKIKPMKGFEFPDNLESMEMDMDSELQDLMQEPHEISLDEREIMEAIGKAKISQRGLIGRLKQKLYLIRQKKAKTEEKVYDIGQRQNAEISYGLENIQKRIDDARSALMDFNLQKAREMYIEIMNIYNHLKPEEQAKVYGEIRDLYFERKSAEQLKA